MNLQKEVREWFLNFVETNPKTSQGLKEAMVGSQRMFLDQYIIGLTKQINKAIMVQKNRGRKDFKRETVKQIVQDFANVFVYQMESKANERMESDLSRSLRATKEQEKVDMEKTLDGTPSGVFEEYAKDGLTIGETEVKTV